MENGWLTKLAEQWEREDESMTVPDQPREPLPDAIEAAMNHLISEVTYLNDPEKSLFTIQIANDIEDAKTALRQAIVTALEDSYNKGWNERAVEDGTSW